MPYIENIFTKYAWVNYRFGNWYNDLNYGLKIMIHYIIIYN